MDRREVAQALERMLADTLPRGVDLGPETPLSSTGMSSMRAARLWVEIEETFGVDVPLSSLSGAVTLDELAATIAAESALGVRSSPSVVTDSSARLEPFPLTPIQESYLAGAHPELTADAVGCRQYLELELEEIDPERLEAAWERLVEHHDMLRAVVTPDGRQQVLAETPAASIRLHDLRTAPPHEVRARAAEIRRRLCGTRDPAGTEPPVAVEVCLRPDGTGLVHLDVDALFVDGHSLALVLAQWAELYRRPEQPLDVPGVSARDCVLTMVRDRHERDLAYWLERLRDMPAGPSFEGVAGAHGLERTPLSGRLGGAQWSALRERAAACGVSPSALLLAAFADALARAGARSPFSLVLTTSARTWLPLAAADVVAPLTSSAVVVADMPAERAVLEAAPVLHEQVWQALEHAGASGVEALREVRARAGRAPGPLPVVFTSLLDLGPGGRMDRGFAANVVYSVGRTSDVALECQVWEQGDELRFQWDVAAGRLPAGAAESAFALFIRALNAACAPADELPARPLNALQQAYFVARSADADEPWNGCQIYESFEVPDLDPARLSEALCRLVAAKEALRSWVGADGMLHTLAAAPAAWEAPVLDLAGLPDPDAALAAIRDELAGRAFPLGRWPQFDVRVTVGTGDPIVHCVFDVALYDAPSVHALCRELLRLYAEPDARPGGTVRRPEVGSDEERSHWEERAASLPPGPVLPGGAEGAGRRRVRYEARLPGWRRLVRHAEAHGVAPDALLLSAFTEVLAEELEADDFAVSVVRWSDADDPYRPGELTRLSWLRAAPRGEELLSAARRYHRELAQDQAADGVEGLAVVRRRIMSERAHGAFAYPVVYSCVVDLSDRPLPPGVRAGPWLSCTPDVSLDCIGTAEGDELFYCWDGGVADFPPGWLPAAFARYGHVLSSFASGAAVPPLRRGPLSRSEYRTVVHAWNDTERDFPRRRPAHALFEERARAQPDATAVRSRSGSATYGALNAEANAIAWRLHDLGARRGSVVAVGTRRDPAMVAAVLGVLKAGGAYLPLEPSLPAERALGLLRRTGASILLTTSNTTRWDVPGDVTVLEIDGDLPRRDEDPPHHAEPEDTAYVIFTSGSTGTPKGVAVPHRAISNLLAWGRSRFAFGAGDVGLAVTSLGFDLSVFDILGLLGYGAALYVADEEEQRDPALLLDALVSEGVTFWNSAPTTLAQLAPLFDRVRGDPRTQALRLVFLSGDHTPLWLPGQVRATFGNAELVSLGGATEATVWSNVLRIGEVDPEWRSIPYGRPIDNARYYVLDGDLQPVAVGDEGDLYIAGECLASGYYAEPALTAERFVPDPFGVRPGERMYRTGDRASFLPDGTIRFHGRADGQVKVRGFRVELGEIEHRLRKHPAVRDVVVLARYDSAGDRKVVAYVVPASSPPPSTRELREHAAASLPDYMLPNFVCFVDEFPATANGKLDRDALPWPVTGAADGSAPAPAEPGGGSPDLEELCDEIAGLFAELLEQPSFDPAQDIWDQGATSFTLVQVSNALQQRYEQRIPVSAVLGEPTVTTIAGHLHAALTGDVPPPAVDFFSADEREAFKAGHWNLRAPAAGADPVPLEAATLDDLYERRASRRDFLDAPVSSGTLGRLLGLLREATVEGRPRYLYPSAGDTYAVQVYVHVKPEGVEGLAPGTYYYRAAEHVLEPVGDGSGLDRSIHFYYNRPLYDAAAFELYLIGQTRAVEPLYRENGERYLALEAGHIAELLMLAQAELGLGLCQIGEVRFDRLRPELRLDDGHRFLLGFVGGRTEQRPASPLLLHRPREATDVAVVGLGGRYPQAENVDELWRLLEEGRDCIEPLPEERRRPGWPTEMMWGAWLDGVDRFDSLFFGITPRDADLMDPQERLFLEVAWEALEDAGYPRSRLCEAHGGRVGVFAATMYSEYPFFGVEQSLRAAPVSTGSSIADIANRVSYFLDLKGPSMTVDTMCSSSLTSLHLAVASLRSGECEVALAGGVNLSLHPNKFVEQARLGMSSTDHRCRAFGAGGDGFAPGEGVGVVVLKPLPAAIADGDRIQAVVKATAVNHGGRTNGYMVPSADAHAEVIAEALAQAGVPAASIGYVEAHGTGTALGDPVEIEGLERAFVGAELPPGSCAVGSVKSNIGHLEGAAGIAGLTKVVLQLRHRRLVPTLHAGDPNPAVDWARSPFRPQLTAAEWPAPVVDGGPAPRRAGLSSFGAGGANAHVVVEAYEDTAAEQRPIAPRSQLLVLSARDEERLRVLAGRLAARLETGEDLDLRDVAYTLQVGREPLRERLAVVASDRGGAAEALNRFARGEMGRVVVATGLDGASLAALGEGWVRGEPVDWPRLHPEGRPRIVSLPSYPFARRRHWLPEPESQPAADRAVPLYTKGWQPAADPAPAAAAPVVLCLHTAASEPLARRLAEAGGPGVTLLREGSGFFDETSAVAALRALLAREPGLEGCIDLCDLGRADADPGPWTARLAVVKELLAGRRAARLLLAVEGLQDLPGPQPTLAGARLAGFVRALDAESPRLRATVVDVVGADDVVRWLLEEWATDDGAAEVCYRGGRRYRPRLEPVEVSATTPRLDPVKAYLVTGGTGEIGTAIARHLCRRGARRIALLGLRPAHETTAIARVRELEAAGAQVALFTGPLTDRERLGGFLADVRRSLGEVGGVVHCAGRMAPIGPFANKDLADVQAVLEPKVDGLEALADACAGDRPSFFVLFSSVSALVPRLAAGVVEYAAANSFLDFFAGHAARSGRPEVRSIAWPSWRGTGMTGKGEVDVGLAELEVDEGLAVLDAVLAQPLPAYVVVAPRARSDLDPQTLLAAPAAAPPPSPSPAGPSAPVPEWLTSVFAETTGIPERELDPTVPFGNLGVESVLLAELVAKLEGRLGRPVEPSTLLEHPTLERLAAQLGAESPGPERADERRVAVVGLACRFPGAPDVSAFWENLRAGRRAIVEVPQSRWDASALYRPVPEVGKTISKWGGFVESVEDFDPDFFGMTDEEATCLDPAIRLVLEGAATALRDAGYADGELEGRDVGVFVGARLSEYRRRIGVRDGSLGFGGDQNFAAARVAQHFDFTGPNMVVDSACSSALVAVQLAVRSLLAGESELALAAGVEVLLDEQPYLEFSAVQALSPAGRCRAFDERADGFVPGEGCGVVLLKRLDRALADGDRVRAVIEAVAVGNDGRTIGLTTPNPVAQAAVVRRALRESGRRAEEIGMVEAHGTATMIGDPIELRALTDVFRETTGRSGFCAIGSVKSSVGHLLSAAGSAGLVKAVLAVEHGEIPPTIDCETPNPRFDFAASPFFPCTELRPWPAEAYGRVAGVSAFGLGGTNVHVVVGALDPAQRPASPRQPLPPPDFRRRRLWLERPDAVEAPSSGNGLVSSLLDFSFTGDPERG